MSGDIRIGDRTVETNVAVDSAVLVDPKGYLTAALRIVSMFHQIQQPGNGSTHQKSVSDWEAVGRCHF